MRSTKTLIIDSTLSHPWKAREDFLLLQPASIFDITNHQMSSLAAAVEKSLPIRALLQEI